MENTSPVPAGAAGAGTDGLPFPVVGIGASAGGLAALAALLGAMPPRPGMALVVVLHLASDEPSAADKVLQRACAMPVVQVAHTQPVLPDHVYMIPPDRSLRIRAGLLELDRLERSGCRHVAADIFLRSLAEAQGGRAVGIVLSGMGSDGTAGLARIKALGGTTIVQLPTDAAYDAMPRAAIDAGMADFVLAAAAIPRKLGELRDAAPHGIDPPAQAALQEALAVLRARTGQDFSAYKPATLLRRLQRRMLLRAQPDLAAYCRLLRADEAEASALLKDFLIGVTRFFRDPEAFEALERLVVAKLVASAGHPLRAWVPACASGEEAYSLGMLLAEQAARCGAEGAWQVFASDVDEQALASARAGLYPETAAACIAPARLQRYFTRDGARFKVRGGLREHILFARHDLLQAPAFSRLDLISCRNVLIYLNQATCRQLLQHFHFALNPEGYLLLGNAESADAAPELFVPVDPARRIYRARPLARATWPFPALPVPPAAGAGMPALRPGAAPAGVQRGRLFSFAEIHQHKVVELAPPSILLDAGADIVHVSERAARYLRLPGGATTRALADLVLPELALACRAALFQARQRLAGVDRSAAPRAGRR